MPGIGGRFGREPVATRSRSQASVSPDSRRTSRLPGVHGGGPARLERDAQALEVPRLLAQPRARLLDVCPSAGTGSPCASRAARARRPAASRNRRARACAASRRRPRRPGRCRGCRCLQWRALRAHFDCAAPCPRRLRVSAVGHAFLVPAAQLVVLGQHLVEAVHEPLGRAGLRRLRLEALRQVVVLLREPGGEVEFLLEVPDALADEVQVLQRPVALARGLQLRARRPAASRRTT